MSCLLGCLYADKYIKKVMRGGGGDITEHLYTYNSYLYFRTGFKDSNGSCKLVKDVRIMINRTLFYMASMSHVE